MTKIKIGDKVRGFKFHNCPNRKLEWVDLMESYVGKTGVVADISNSVRYHCFTVEFEDGCCWHYPMELADQALIADQQAAVGFRVGQRVYDIVLGSWGTVVLCQTADENFPVMVEIDAVPDQTASFKRSYTTDGRHSLRDARVLYFGVPDYSAVTHPVFTPVFEPNERIFALWGADNKNTAHVIQVASEDPDTVYSTDDRFFIKQQWTFYRPGLPVEV